MSDVFVHETAVVDQGALIGQGSRVWHFVHVSSGAEIGEQCSLGQNVYVASTAIIGNGVKIQNNVAVYDGVTIEDDVFCGPSMVFTNVYNPRAFIERKDEYRLTRVKQGASLGANCTIVCGSTIGRYAFIGAGAVVRSDVPDYALIVGVPGRQIGWVSRAGHPLELPLDGSGTATCPETGAEYRLVGSELTVAG